MSDSTQATSPTTEQSNEEKEAGDSGGTASNITKDAKAMTFVVPAASLDLSDEVPIDGSATLEVKYL